jgi:hypothetical protein
LKARVVLEAIKDEKTPAESASILDVHPGVIAQWKSTCSRMPGT